MRMADRKFAKRVENTVVKGEIAHYKHFLLFPQCCGKSIEDTKKNLYWRHEKKKQGLFGKGLKSFNF